LESSDTSALLKTPAKTYVLRQKNTSNALILLKPYAAESSLEQGLAAISTSHETVELDIARTQNLPAEAAKAPTSKGKWHERFGRNR
jgi:hypothetical protein